MIFPWRRLLFSAAQRAAQDPEMRRKAQTVARHLGNETRNIANSPDKAKAAGQSVRRAGEALRRHLNKDSSN